MGFSLGWAAKLGSVAWWCASFIYKLSVLYWKLRILVINLNFFRKKLKVYEKKCDVGCAAWPLRYQIFENLGV